LSSRLRNGIIIAVVGLLLVVFGIFVLNGIFSQTRTADQVPTPEAPITSKVLVTTHDLPLGAFLGESDLKVIDIPVGFVPRNALTNIESAVGRFTKFQLVSGEMVLQHHLADPTNVNQDLAYILSENHVLMAFPAFDLLSRHGVIQRGDIVDIFVSVEFMVDVFESGSFGSVEEEKIRALFTFDSLQRVSITAMVVEVLVANADGTTRSSTSAAAGPEVGGEVGEDGQVPSPSEKETLAYLLALDPQDALILKYLRDAGGIFDFVIRSPSSTQPFILDPVTAEFIRELYGLEIIR
jgi:pilus assembly protein CpaB